jgi:hypothetical protein
MKNSVLILTASHFALFIGGVVVGKKINGDELSMYRETHESRFTRWTRKATNVALGLGFVSTMIVIVRASRRAALASGSSGAASTSTAAS